MREMNIVELLNALVRPVLALGFAAAVIFMSITGDVSVDAFLGIATLVVTWYFKSRDESKNNPPTADK